MSVSARRGRARPARTLAKRLLRDPERRAGYDFCRALSRRERQFRLRTYPMMAFALVIGLGLALRHGEAREPAMLCSPIYLLGLYTPLFLTQTRFSENWEARWILRATPLSRPGRFAGGAIAAIAMTLLLPMYLVLLAIVVLIGGSAVLIHAVFATEAMLAMGGISALLIGRHVPFTDKISKSGAQGSFGPFMALSMVVAVLVLVHYVLSQVPLLMYAAIVALVPLLWIVLDRLSKIDVRVERWSP